MIREFFYHAKLGTFGLFQPDLRVFHLVHMISVLLGLTLWLLFVKLTLDRQYQVTDAGLA